jgi:hypothetical protein
MKPFYKSVSIALALNFPEAKSADDHSTPLHEADLPVIVYPPESIKATSVANVTKPSTSLGDCSGRLIRIVEDSLASSALRYPFFCSQLYTPTLSSAFVPGGFTRIPLIDPPSVYSVLCFTENIHEWLSYTAAVISPGEAFRIIDALPADSAAKLAAKSKINEMAVKFFGGLLKSTLWTLSPEADFPYRIIDLKGDETLSFVAHSAPLEGTDAVYNTFAGNLYEQLSRGTNDLTVLDILNASPTPKGSVAEHAIAMTPQLLGIFASFHRALTNLRCRAAASVDSRFSFMRAAAHSLCDFNRADTGAVGRMWASASHYVMAHLLWKTLLLP